MSQLGETALEFALEDLDAGVRGGEAPYARFRSPVIDGYQRLVGLQVPPAISVQGFPWCAAAVFSWFQGAADQLGIPNPCPRTASAWGLWHMAPEARSLTPQPGAVFVLDRGGGHGHTGIVESVDTPTGLLGSVEGDTSNALGSATGDAVGRHSKWDPKNRRGFTLVGYLVF